MPTFSFYLVLSTDVATTERPAKKAKTVVPKVKFADLREDVRANAIQTMPSKLTFEGHQWKCSSRVFSQKDDGWTAYYSCCHKADREGCCDGRIIVKTTRDFRLVVCGIRDIFYFLKSIDFEFIFSDSKSKVMKSHTCHGPQVGVS